MAGDVQNIKLGACDVYFNDFYLGLTKGGVEVTLATTTYAITVDQFGGTNVNEFITGRTVGVKVPLVETALELFQIAVPGSTIVVDKTVSTKRMLKVPTAVGTSLLKGAGVLRLHPRNSLDNNDDFTIPIAAPKGDFSFTYEHDKERVYSVEFTGYTSLSTGLLFIVGDTTADDGSVTTPVDPGNGGGTTDPGTGTGGGTTTPTATFVIANGVWTDAGKWIDTSTWTG